MKHYRLFEAKKVLMQDFRFSRQWRFKSTWKSVL